MFKEEIRMGFRIAQEQAIIKYKDELLSSCWCAMGYDKSECSHRNCVGCSSYSVSYETINELADEFVKELEKGRNV